MDCFLEFLVECCCEGGCEGGCEICGETVSANGGPARLVGDIIMALLTLCGIASLIAGAVTLTRHSLDKQWAIGLLIAGGVLLVGGVVYFGITQSIRRKKRRSLQEYILQESAKENLAQNQYRMGVIGQSTVQPTPQQSESVDTTKDTDGKEK